MTGMAAGFVDVGFVRAVVADAHGLERAEARLNAAAVASLVGELARKDGKSLLRTYWYDGQYPPDSPRFLPQLKYLDAVGRVPGIRLRLGSLVERIPTWQRAVVRALEEAGVDPTVLSDRHLLHPEVQQKGVDTLIVLDLLQLSIAGAYDTAILLTGDRDLSEAVRAVQDQGRRVVLVTPPGNSTSTGLRSLADEAVTLSQEQVRALQLGNRPTTPPAPSPVLQALPAPARRGTEVLLGVAAHNLHVAREQPPNSTRVPELARAGAAARPDRTQGVLFGNA